MVQKDLGLDHWVPVPPPDAKRLRDWWHQILREHNRHACYAIFLAFSSDGEVLKYLMSSYDEIDIMSGESCLVFIISDKGYLSFGPKLKFWDLLLEDHIGKGNNATIAKLFKVRFEDFPCLLLFRDIRQSEHVQVSLSGLTKEEIKNCMREVFSIVNEAVSASQDPLKALDKNRNHQAFLKKSQSVIKTIGKLADQTLEKAMGAFIEALIKK